MNKWNSAYWQCWMRVFGFQNKIRLEVPEAESGFRREDKRACDINRVPGQRERNNEERSEKEAGAEPDGDDSTTAGAEQE